MTKTEQKKQEAALKRILKNQKKITAVNGILQNGTNQIITDTYRMIELNHPLDLPLDDKNRVTFDQARKLFPTDQQIESCDFLWLSLKEVRTIHKAAKEEIQAGLKPDGWPDWMIEIDGKYRLNARYLLDCMQALGYKDTLKYPLWIIPNDNKAGKYFTYYLSSNQGRALLVGIR